MSGEDTVEHGGNYTFTLTMDEGYSQCDPVVKVNGEVISEGPDGKYTVTGVEKALNITVEGVTIDTFTVSVIEGSGYTISGENSKTVSYNQIYCFRYTCGRERRICTYNNRVVGTVCKQCNSRRTKSGDIDCLYGVDPTRRK